VLVFVMTGRADHHAAGSLAGLADPAWPFLTAGPSAGLSRLAAAIGPADPPAREVHP
jgi:hypothetical protein